MRAHGNDAEPMLAQKKAQAKKRMGKEMGARTTTPDARADKVRTIPINANTVRNSGTDYPSRDISALAGC